MAASEPHGRKADHLRIATDGRVLHRRGAGLDGVRLRHRALPERDLRDVALSTGLLGARLAAPIVVSAMTGGTGDAERVNARLAEAAAEHGVGMTLGSGRVLLEDPSLLGTYRPARSPARPPLLLANLGGVQLVADGGPERAEALVDLLAADGLSVHLNAIQEAVQPEGEPSFGGIAERIAATVTRLAPRPVVVKEVGFGMDGADVALLRDAGVAAVDVAGAGGTNWALVEGRRDPRAGAVAEAFADWAWPPSTRSPWRWPPRPACRCWPRAACATAWRPRSAWRWGRSPSGWPGPSCRPPRRTGRARPWGPSSSSCGSPRGRRARRRRPRSAPSTSR